jgi:hypothetical protein
LVLAVDGALSAAVSGTSIMHLGVSRSVELRDADIWRGALSARAADGTEA